ncbi:zinc ribbon domain-containing protein [Priestia aryabhattai]
MNICPKCNHNGSTEKATIESTHKMFNFEIVVENIPAVICNKCGYAEYLYPKELDFQLRDAYRNRINNISFKLDK